MMSCIWILQEHHSCESEPEAPRAFSDYARALWALEESWLDCVRANSSAIADAWHDRESDEALVETTDGIVSRWTLTEQVIDAKPVPCWKLRSA